MAQRQPASTDQGLLVRVELGQATDGRSRSEQRGRSATKHTAIIQAATTLFLRNGYQGTSIDDIAATAAVSKQTVYKNFGDKEQLFGAIILGVTATAEEFADLLANAPEDDDVEAELRTIARRYLGSVMRPQVLQLRRLVIAEAGRFPDLARTYYERAPLRVLNALAAKLGRLAERGLLRIDDPSTAADHFAFLILGRPLDQAMFSAEAGSLTEAELNSVADNGVRVFLAAYRAN
jgi:TetR/AcrR family transcriptional repressor of mexJK operon